MGEGGRIVGLYRVERHSKIEIELDEECEKYDK